MPSGAALSGAEGAPGSASSETDAEVAYRLTVCASTLCLADSESTQLARALGLLEHILALKGGAPAKATPKLGEALSELGAQLEAAAE